MALRPTATTAAWSSCPAAAAAWRRNSPTAASRPATLALTSTAKTVAWRRAVKRQAVPARARISRISSTARSATAALCWPAAR